MRKLFLSIVCVLLTMQMMAAYYVAGNGSAGNPWCDGKSWDPAGSVMTEQSGVWTKTFKSVPLGSYQFKVTNGSWSTNFGYDSFSQDGSNFYPDTNSDGNIVFSVDEQQDITVSFNGTKIFLNGSIGGKQVDPSEQGVVGVPSEYEGVMLQAFYWEAQKLDTYSRLKYIDLLNSGLADEMGKTFDLVWMPPAGQGGGVGYYCNCYSKLDSDWGTKAKLQEVIGKLHENGCMVLADIVINHFNSSRGWAQAFNTNNFGSFGSFTISSKHICSGDEAFTDSSSDSKNLEKGAADTGTNDGGCRDLDHTNSYVQDMCKAYTKWMRSEIQYDGFRYDMTLGYHGKYLSMYNVESKPFFSVSECWSDLATIQSHLKAANYNTLAFDFPMKYKFNDWKGGANYSNLKNKGLRSVGLTKNAVTFIDNHDTFHRSDNQGGEFLGYNTNLSNKKRQIIEANAYLLMMPGVPCVFWPHWYTFRKEINDLIAIRKAVGIHSESVVTDETAGTNTYSATIEGHHGSVILRMGSARDTSIPKGYGVEYRGDNFDIYSTLKTPVDDVTVEGSAKPSKMMENGQVYILKEGERYSVDGRMVER